MKSPLWLLCVLAVLRNAYGDCLQEVLEAKPHDASHICVGKKNWALVPHPHDCHKFYVCANHVPEEFTCAQNYYYDVHQSRCILGSCSAVKECQSWVRRVPEDCSAFEICSYGNYEREYCGTHQFFDEASSSCAPIKNSVQHKCSCILPQYSVLANIDNCESYFVCVDGRAQLQKCPRGQYFDARLNTCLVDMNSVCIVAPSITNPEENAMNHICERLGLKEDTTAAGGFIYQPDAHDCGKFYICVNGRAIMKHCPPGFYFDRELNYCQYDSNGQCETIRDQAKKKKKQKEKEALEKENEKATHEKDTNKEENNHNEIHENEPKPPVKLSLSLTHVKVNVEKGDATQSHSQSESHSVQAIKPAGETKPTDEVALNAPVVVPPILDLPLSNVGNEKRALLDEMLPESIDQLDESIEQPVDSESNESAAEATSVEIKLPMTESLQTQLKLPSNSAYDKLSSKFVAFRK